MEIKAGDLVTVIKLLSWGTEKVLGLVTKVYQEPHWLYEDQMMYVCEFKTVKTGKMETYYMHYLEKVNE